VQTLGRGERDRHVQRGIVIEAIPVDADLVCAANIST
jgi:hypothetical protein